MKAVQSLVCEGGALLGESCQRLPKVLDLRVNLQTSSWVFKVQVSGGGSVFSYAPCFVNLAPAAIAAFATGISVAPSIAVITPEGINIQPQGLNIQPVSCWPISVTHICIDLCKETRQPVSDPSPTARHICNTAMNAGGTV